MNIVCPPGDRRTQIILWNIPVADTIITYQQCFIQRFHSMWIKKIDCLYSYIVFLFSIKTRINKKYCFSFPIYELKHHSFRPTRKKYSRLQIETLFLKPNIPNRKNLFFFIHKKVRNSSFERNLIESFGNWGCVKIPPFFFLCWPTYKVKSKKIVLYKIKLFLCKVTRFKRYYK